VGKTVIIFSAQGKTGEPSYPPSQY